MNEAMRQVITLVSIASGIACAAIIIMVVRDLCRKEKDDDGRGQR